tara:strand:- start:28 stop:738 length:711 start_codon:yes stop_codon:yes gene_type:complete
MEKKILMCGYHTVIEALKNKNRKVSKIFALDLKKIPENFKNITQIVNKSFFEKKFANYNISHQNIAVEVSDLSSLNLKLSILNKKIKNIAILDGISDPTNIGSIIRLCAGFAIDSLMIEKKYLKKESPVIAKIASGGLEHINVFKVTNINQSIKLLKENNFWITGLDEKSDYSIYKHTWSDFNGIVLGSEGYGIKKTTKLSCDYLLKIPMANQISSINVSTSAAICFASIFNKRLI